MADRLTMGILASGRGSNLQSIMDKCACGDIAAEVKVVISDRGDAGALIRARQRGIPAEHIDRNCFPSRNDYESAVAARLSDYGVELVVLAGYMRMIGPVLLSASDKIMNIHPSLLPSFPGLEAQKQALQAGVKVSGCTVHFVDEGMDTGPIIAQRAVPVQEDDTVKSLSDRIVAVEHQLYPECIDLYARGLIVIDGRRTKIEGRVSDDQARIDQCL